MELPLNRRVNGSSVVPPAQLEVNGVAVVEPRLLLRLVLIVASVIQSAQRSGENEGACGSAEFSPIQASHKTHQCTPQLISSQSSTSPGGFVHDSAFYVAPPPLKKLQQKIYGRFDWSLGSLLYVGRRCALSL